MILVVGATGLLGSEVCRRLLLRGDAVRALVRTTSAPEKIEALQAMGAQIHYGDLKAPASLEPACKGIKAIVSTASSTFSRQPGDSIESVDAGGQLNLVKAAKAAGIDRFVFVSFRRPPGVSFPLGDAKQAVEEAIAGMNSTIIQASYFNEVHLSPPLGFNWPEARARVNGPGASPISWVSFTDVAEMCVIALHQPAAERRVIEFGGPQPLTIMEVIGIFERLGGGKFKVQHVPEQELFANFEAAQDPLEKSFAALMLGSAYGDAMDMSSVIEEFDLKLESVEEYAAKVLSSNKS